MTRPILSAAVLALLAGCAGHPGPGPDRPTLQIVRTEVAVPCAAAQQVRKPAFADTAEALAAIPAGGILALAKAYAAGRQQHYAYEAALEAAVSGCAKP